MRAGIITAAVLLLGCGASDPDANPTDGRAGDRPGAHAGENGGGEHAGSTVASRGANDAGVPTDAGSTAAMMTTDASRGPAGGAGSSAADDGAVDAGAASLDGGAGPVDRSCLDGITDYTERGPFTFDAERSGDVYIWVPEVPSGCKVPVVHFANGTGATCSAYLAILEHLASHGFITACTENPASDDGTRCLTALRTVFSAYPDLADMSIGSTGQETGGATAIACIARAEDEWKQSATYAGHAIAPMSGAGPNPGWMTQYASIESPVFMLNGSNDALVSAASVQLTYDALNGEKYWYEATGAPHIPIPAAWAAESAVVFFRWKLLGDEAAGDYFAAMPASDRWDLQGQQP